MISLFSMMLNLISQYLYHPSCMLISTYQVMNKIVHKIYTPQFILTLSSMHSVIPSHFPNYNLNYFTLEDMDLHFFFFFCDNQLLKSLWPLITLSYAPLLSRPNSFFFLRRPPAPLPSMLLLLLFLSS